MLLALHYAYIFIPKKKQVETKFECEHSSIVYSNFNKLPKRFILKKSKSIQIILFWLDYDT